MGIDVKELALKYIDVKGLAVEGILEGMVFKKLDELVLDSENKLDDAMAEMLKPLIKQYVADALDSKLA